MNLYSSKVAIVYQHLPHYRYGVFKELQQQIPNLKFIADGSSRDGSIKVIPWGTFEREALVRNRWIGPFLWQKGLGRELRAYDPDAIIFLGDGAYLSTWFYALISRILRKKVFFWTIGWHRPEKGLIRFIRMAFYRLSNALLLYGEIARDIGLEMGYPAHKMFVIGNSTEGFPDTVDMEEEFSYQQTPDSLVVGAVIRLNPVKQLPMLIKAVAEINAAGDFPNVEVLIVGEGPERSRLQALADELDVKLTMPGAFYSMKTIEKIYEILDLTVVPSTVGLTAIQSMNHGVPVISDDSKYTQAPEWESIKSGVTGEVFREGDVGSLASAMRRALTRLSFDREAYRYECLQEISLNWSSRSSAKRITDALVGADCIGLAKR